MHQHGCLQVMGGLRRRHGNLLCSQHAATGALALQARSTDACKAGRPLSGLRTPTCDHRFPGWLVSGRLDPTTPRHHVVLPAMGGKARRATARAQYAKLGSRLARGSAPAGSGAFGGRQTPRSKGREPSEAGILLRMLTGGCTLPSCRCTPPLPHRWRPGCRLPAQMPRPPLALSKWTNPLAEC